MKKLLRHLLSGLSVFACIIALSSTLWASGLISDNNRSHKYDGHYTAEILTKDKETVSKKVNVEIEGIFIRIPVGKEIQEFRINDMFDRRYEMEITCHRDEGDVTYVVKLNTSSQDSFK